MTTQFSKKVLLKAVYYGGLSVIEGCKAAAKARELSQKGEGRGDVAQHMPGPGHPQGSISSTRTTHSSAQAWVVSTEKPARSLQAVRLVWPMSSVICDSKLKDFYLSMADDVF